MFVFSFISTKYPWYEAFFFIMPFRRRRTRRRRSTRPTALRAVRRLARFVDTELHQSLSIVDSVAIPDTGLFVQLVFVGQGDDDLDRTGVQIALRSVRANLHFTRGSVDSTVRYILFVDKQTNGVIPVQAQLLEEIANPLQAINSPLNNDFKRRFTILQDRKLTIIDGHSNLSVRTVSKRLTNMVRYTGATTALTSVSSGMVWLYFGSDQATGGQMPDLAMVSRIWFAP